MLLNLDDETSRAALARLHVELDAGISARLPWIEAWRESHPAWEPWVPALLERSGEVLAAAPLTRRSHLGFVDVRELGYTGLDVCPVVFRTAEDADELASFVVNELATLNRPWKMHLDQLTSGCAFASGLARRLKVAVIRDGSGRPIVSLPGGRDPRKVTSANLLRADAKARNRIARAGHQLEERWIVEPAQIAERFPEIRSVHRARDLQLRGYSLLDDEDERGFYDALVRRHLDQLDLFELRLDGELGAYVLWIRNGRVRNVLDNRVSPRWTAFSAGLIANNVALSVAAADPAVEILDWGAGVQRYKLQSSNKVIPHDQLTAWSSVALRKVCTVRRRIASG